MTYLIIARLVALTGFVMLTISGYWELLQQFNGPLLLLMVPPILFIASFLWTFFLAGMVSKMPPNDKKPKIVIAIFVGLLLAIPFLYLIVMSINETIFEKPSWVHFFSVPIQIQVSNSISNLLPFSWLIGGWLAITIIEFVKQKTISQNGM